jgi:hypothetical protein
MILGDFAKISSVADLKPIVLESSGKVNHVATSCDLFIRFGCRDTPLDRE